MSTKPAGPVVTEAERWLASIVGGQPGQGGGQDVLVDRDLRGDVDLVEDRPRFLDDTLDGVPGPSDRERLVEHRVDVGAAPELGIGQGRRSGRGRQTDRPAADRGEGSFELGRQPRPGSSPPRRRHRSMTPAATLPA